MKIYVIICSLFLATTCLAETFECQGTTGINTVEVIATFSSQCRKLSGKKVRARYVRRKFLQLRKIRPLFTRPVWQTLKKGKNKLLKQNCPAQTISESTCSAAEPISSALILAQISEMACTQTFSQDRKKSLRMIEQTFAKLEAILGSDIKGKVEQTVDILKVSKSCGKGGSDLLNYCDAIYETADGIGMNVYKLLEYAPHLPIFITRDDAKICTARRKSGSVIETLRYTGLANPDVAGLRHHYRFSKSCTQLPELFYIECAGRCYEINDSCVRID